MKRKRKNILFVLLLFILLILGILGWLVGPTSIADWLIHPKEALKKAQVTVGRTIANDSNPVNILLIGNNARDANNPLSLGTAAGKADILIVVHIDPTTHQVTLISIPRDTL